MKAGRFITCEGQDCVGKSTQAKNIKAILESHGYEVILTREPGGTPLAEKVRGLVLGDAFTPYAELLLFAASRAEHLQTKIIPALEAGKIVISDRFADSSYAYQGAGRGYIPQVLELEKFVLGDFQPDYTLFFDITYEESVLRLNKRSSDGGEINHLDTEQEDFKRRVNQGYKDRYHAFPNRMHLIDATPSIDEVATTLKLWVENVFIPQNPRA